METTTSVLTRGESRTEISIEDLVKPAVVLLKSTQEASRGQGLSQSAALLTAPAIRKEVKSVPLPYDGFGWQAIKNSLGRQMGRPDFSRKGSGAASEPTIIYGYRQIEPSPHWLLIALGTSELFEKQCSEPEVSGKGYELVLRFAGRGDAPSEQAVDLVSTVFRYAMEEECPLAAGHTLDLTQMLQMTKAHEFGALVLRQDPKLKMALTPNGALDFLQIVAISKAEQECVRDWNSEGVLELLEEYECPGLIAATERHCLTSHDKAVELIEEKVRSEGSSSEYLFATGSMAWDDMSGSLTIEKELVEDLCQRIRGRLPFEKPFSAYFDECVFEFMPAEMTEFDDDEACPVLRLSNTACGEFLDLLTSGCVEFSCPEMESLRIVVGGEEK